MSLIDCPECQNRISDKAHACAHCGNPMGQQPGNRWLSEKNVGQVAGATTAWLTAPWIARMVFGVVAMICITVMHRRALNQPQRRLRIRATSFAAPSMAASL